MTTTTSVSDREQRREEARQRREKRRQYELETNACHLALAFMDDREYVWYENNDYFKDPFYLIRKWRGDYYGWHDGHYRPFSRETLELQVTAWLQGQEYRLRATYGQSFRITPGFVRTVLLNLDPNIMIRESTEWNDWLDKCEGTPPPVHPRVVAVQNGLLSLEAESAPQLLGHTPNYFNAACLPVVYDPQATCPRWTAFLDDVTNGWQEPLDLLQEWVGYLLRPDLREQKFLLCVGEGANGKSVFFEVVHALLGRDNCSTVSLSRLAHPFSLYATLGKMANLTSESTATLAEEAESILKAFVAGDTLTFERKFRDPLHAVPTAKLMVATNALPRFADKTNGLWRRVLLVPFDKTIPEAQQNKTLARDIIASELPGVFNWALAGLAALNARGYFEPCLGGAHRLEEHRREVNPAHAFLTDTYTAEVNGPGLPAPQVYQAYVQWCQESGYRPVGVSQFGHQVKRTFPDCRIIHRRTATGRITVYAGLAVAEEGQDAAGNTGTSKFNYNRNSPLPPLPEAQVPAHG